LRCDTNKKDTEMTWLREFGNRITGVFRKDRGDADLRDEFAAHLDMLEQENIRRGMSREEAHFAALREFGDVEKTKEIYRERRGLPMLETFLHDLRYGLRMLRKSPGFTAVALLSLALGIGANAAIYSVTNAVFLRTLAVPNPNDVMIVTTQTPKGGQAQAFSVRLFRELQQLNTGTVEIAAYTDTIMMGGASQPERLVGEIVSANYFSVLGVQPILGSTFSAGDDLPGAPNLTIISYSLWQRMYGGTSDVIGKKLIIKGIPFVIIGVAPRQYTGFIRGDGTEFWMTLPATNPDAAVDFAGNNGWLVMVGRLAPGVSRHQAQDRMTARLPSGYERYHDTENWSAALIPAGTGNDRLVTELSRPLRFLLLATGLILLIACSNVANLLLSRGTSRRREIAVRLAMGASRVRIVRQLLTESAMLAMGGAALGLVIAWWAGRAAEGLRTPVGITLSLHAGLDNHVLGFTLACTIIAVLIFGIAPALTASRAEIVTILKDAPEGTGRRRWLSGRTALVILQVALSFALVVTASLFLRSLWKLQNVDLGFSPENVLTMTVSMSGLQNYDALRGSQFYSTALDQVNALPGVRASSFADRLPITPGGTNLLRKPGQTTPSADHDIVINRLTVSPGFFRTLSLPIVRGREFTDADSKDAPPAVIVNESLAETLWPKADPVGQLFADGTKKFTVVGVARNTKHRDLREAQWLTIYRPLAQAYGSGAYLLVRADQASGNITAAVRDRIHKIDPAISITNIRTLPEHIGRSLYLDRLRTTLLSAFGALALLLACVGLYGVMAFQVLQRTRELGIRMALGANPSRVLKMVMGRALGLTSAGLAAGAILSYWVARFAAADLFATQPDDPWTYAASALVLLFAAGAAAFVPARRAMRINPITALRHE
jgi:putative ABC transport system permease protein